MDANAQNAGKPATEATTGTYAKASVNDAVHGKKQKVINGMAANANVAVLFGTKAMIGMDLSADVVAKNGELK